MASSAAVQRLEQRAPVDAAAAEVSIIAGRRPNKCLQMDKLFRFGYLAQADDEINPLQGQVLESGSRRTGRTG